VAMLAESAGDDAASAGAAGWPGPEQDDIGQGPSDFLDVISSGYAEGQAAGRPDQAISYPVLVATAGLPAPYEANLPDDDLVMLLRGRTHEKIRHDGQDVVANSAALDVLADGSLEVQFERRLTPLLAAVTRSARERPATMTALRADI